jgi:molybdate transport system substrate-binding protein
MRFRSAHIRSLVLAFAAVLLLAGSASAAEVRVMISGGLTAAFNALVPEFERATATRS